MSVFAYYLLPSEQQRYYLQAVKAIENLTPAFPAGVFGVPEINNVLHAVLTDHPGYFWFEGKWSFMNKDGSLSVCPAYSFDRYDSSLISAGLEQIKRQLIKASPPDNSYENMKFIYDWILDNVSYGISGNDEGQTIYSALVLKKSLCKGLSKTFQYLLEETGCFCTLQEGTLNGKVKHVWNVIELDGSYYNVDVSLGYDQFDYMFEETGRYRCFAVSDQRIEKTHMFYPHSKVLKCEHDCKGER